MFLTLSNVSI